MAEVIVTFKLMPQSPDVDLAKMEADAKNVVEGAQGKFHKAEIEPIAFGLKALKVIMVRDESLGDTEGVEQELAGLDGVESCQVVNVGRTLG